MKYNLHRKWGKSVIHVASQCHQFDRLPNFLEDLLLVRRHRIYLPTRLRHEVFPHFRPINCFIFTYFFKLMLCINDYFSKIMNACEF